MNFPTYECDKTVTKAGSEVKRMQGGGPLGHRLNVKIP